MFNVEYKNPEENTDSPYSFGTYPVFKSLFDLIPKYRADTICINTYTIVRNNLNKNIAPNDIVNKIMFELHELIQDVMSIFTSCQIFKPHILMYHYDYREIIPTDHLRPLNKNRQLQYDIFKKLKVQLDAKKQFEQINGVTVSTLVVRTILPIYKLLYNAIGSVHNNRKVIMMSHMALDYHLLEQEQQVKLIESYTGELLSKQELGNKVFKKYDIPFTKETHILLGDSNLIKPCLSVKDKKRLQQICNDENWHLKTKYFIKESITKHGFKLPYVLK